MKPLSLPGKPPAAAAPPRFPLLAAAVLSLIWLPDLHAANYIATSQQGNGGTWDSTSFWNPGGLSATANITADPAATFELKIGSRMRTTVGAALVTAPGTAANSFTLDGTGIFYNPNTAGTLYNANESEIRFKQGGSSDRNNGPGPGGGGLTGNPGFGTIIIPNLIMNGGLLDTGNPGTVVLTNGVITVTNGFGTNTMSYFYNDGYLDRGYQIYSQLAGSANLGVHMYAQNVDVYQSNYNHACRIMGVNNTFTGQWRVMGGVLVGGATNASGDGCLGTNTITVDVAGVLETTYNIYNPNANLVLNGQMYLTQDDTFRSVIVGGLALPAGTYSAATLSSLYTNFPSTWTAVADGVTALPDQNFISGSITVLSANTTPITITNPPANTRVLSGHPATFTVGFSGPYTSIQWYSNDVAVGGANGVSYTTPPLTAAATYKVTVANNLNSATASAAASIGTLIPAPGFLTDSVWFGAQYDQTSVQTTPDEPATTRFVNRLDVGAQGATAYGEKLSGFFTPAVAGNYVFFLCSDDSSTLYLSTDNTPANKRPIATQDGSANADLWLSGGGTLTQRRSDQYTPDGITIPYVAGIVLAAGTPYYIEADHTQVSGGANLGVYFKLILDPDPADGTPSNLGGSLVSTMAIDGGSLIITNAPHDTNVVELHSVTLSVGVQATGTPAELSVLNYQWRRGGINIPGATQRNYTTPVLLVGDNNAQFDVVVSMPGAAPVTSTPATVTVSADHVLPVIVESPGAVVNRNGDYEVGVVFSKPLLAATATNLANYHITGATITGAQLFPNTGLDRTWPAVVLTVTGLTPGSTYAVGISGVADLTSSSNVVASTNVAFTASGFSWAAIGATDFYLDNQGSQTTNAVLPWTAVGVGTNGFDLINAGQSYGTFNNTRTEDDLTFAYIPVTNNFDVVVQITYADPAIADPAFAYSQVGLMVRDVIEFSGPTSASGASRFQSLAITPSADYKGSAQVSSHILSVGRTVFNANAADPNTTGPSAPIINLIPAPLPNVWLRMKRTRTDTNDIIALYHSADGINWLGSGDQNMVLNNDPATDLSTNVFVGVFYAASVGPTPFGSIQDWSARVRNFGSIAGVTAVPVSLTNVKATNGQVSFSFNTQLGVSYTVQSTASLSPANWQPVGSPIAGTGNVATVSDTVLVGAGGRFYRVKEQVPQ